MSQSASTAAKPIQVETITAASYIDTLLQRLVSERLLVDLLPGDSNTPYTSTLLQCLPQEGVLLLDEPFPQHGGANPFGTKGEVRLHARLPGAALRFSTTLHSQQELAGARVWRAARPTSIAYHQARREHRVAVLPLQVPVQLVVGEGVVLHGVLQDICGSGIGIRLARSAAGLKRGTPYRCRIDYGGGENLEVRVLLHRAERVEGELPIQLGGELYQLERPQQLQWQRIVTEFERRLLRQ